MDLRDVFGNFERPEHPDFWLLSSVLLRLDGAMEAGDTTFEEVTSRAINIDAALYVAIERVARACDLIGLPVNEKTLPIINGMVALYMEALIVGRESKEGL
jgi:hypothetical protein